MIVFQWSHISLKQSNHSIPGLPYTNPLHCKEKQRYNNISMVFTLSGLLPLTHPNLTGSLVMWAGRHYIWGMVKTQNGKMVKCDMFSLNSTQVCLSVTWAGSEKRFQHLPRLGFWWVIVTTLYDNKFMRSKNCCIISDMLLSILCHNRLPWQQYDLLKTPLILA